MAVDHPVFGTFCEICFRRLDQKDCAVDMDGQAWDVCAGECAREAGIQERPRCQDPECPNFGDPDFGEATCPEEHANPQPTGSAPNSAVRDA